MVVPAKLIPPSAPVVVMIPFSRIRSPNVAVRLDCASSTESSVTLTVIPGRSIAERPFPDQMPDWAGLAGSMVVIWA